MNYSFKDNKLNMIINKSSNIKKKNIQVIKNKIQNENQIKKIQNENQIKKIKIEDIFLKRYKKRVIPLNIFQTWSTLNLTPYLSESVNNIKNNNPEFNYELYDDQMCHDFIKTHFKPDVLYTYDKILPGAYKSDFWRYCILYIKGGIYLDIKFKSNVKLIYLTDREYLVRDRIGINNKKGIYQAIMICKKENILLKKLINHIVHRCKNNIMGLNPLELTGPQLVSHYLSKSLIDSLEFYFHTSGDKVMFKNFTIFYYNSKKYREEQRNENKNLNKLRYYDMWSFCDIYYYKKLLFNKDINLSNQINNNFIYNENYPILNSSNISILLEKESNKLHVVIRYINYKYNKNGCKIIIPKKWISVNKYFTINNFLNLINNNDVINDNNDNNNDNNDNDDNNIILNDLKDNIKNEKYLIYNYELNKFNPDIGHGDVKLFFNKKNEKIYYSSHYDSNTKTIQTSMNLFNCKNILNDNIILTNFNKKGIPEKNWSYIPDYNINNDNEYFIHSWFPLKICYINKKSEILKLNSIHKMPNYFKNSRGNCPGLLIGDEYYFINHKVLKHNRQNRIYYNYSHFITIFNKDFKLIKFSECFKFKNQKVEFCLGMQFDDNTKNFIFSYSTLDYNTFISTIHIDDLNSQLKWYIY